MFWPRLDSASFFCLDGCMVWHSMVSWVERKRNKHPFMSTSGSHIVSPRAENKNCLWQSLLCRSLILICAIVDLIA